MNPKASKVVLAEGRFLRLVRVGRWEYAERTNTPGGVAIIAVTQDQKLLLVEQFRLPCETVVIELPAGIAGDTPETASEALQAAASRELLEETGYAADEWHQIMTGPSSAGLTSELITFFVARQARRVSAGGGDGHEVITVHEVPLAEIERWLRKKMRAGILVDYKIHAGLHFLRMLNEGG